MRASNSARDDSEIPTTATIAEIPMATPRIKRGAQAPAGDALKGDASEVLGREVARHVDRRRRSARDRRVARSVAIGMPDLVIVGDDDDGLTVSLQLSEEIEHDVARGTVEVPGGLVGEDEGGFFDDGAGHGNTLLLATGQGRRSMSAPMRPDRPAQALRRPEPGGHRDGAPTVQQSHRDVVEHAQSVEKEELLEHEPDSGPPR